jgi:hypothetical protein
MENPVVVFCLIAGLLLLSCFIIYKSLKNKIGYEEEKFSAITVQKDPLKVENMSSVQKQ